MPDFTPTEEQLAITEMAQTSDQNFAVIARAGAAKTSTLVLIAEALPETDILCLAFNKAIATEMTARLPSNCEARTLHSLGMEAWRKFTGKKMDVKSNKNYLLLKARIDRLEGDDKDEAYEHLAETLDIISSGKSQGYLPTAYTGHWKPLIGDGEFFAGLPMEPTALQIALVQDVSAQSFSDALSGRIDFDDMILCPALCSVSWPRPSLTLIDEAQDLSPINHHILRKLVKRNRIIAVGDPCQPLGTMVTKVVKKGDRWNEPKLAQVPIEEIVVGDTVLGHNANGSFIYNRKVEGITRKAFSGNLVVAGPTRYTPNHHCYARFAALSERWCIYLMHKGGAYRIGKSRMAYGEQGLGPQIRAKAENADAMWILDTYETETDALIAEAVIQAEFGLSDLCFVDPSRPWLDTFWAEMRTLDLETRARACLSAYNRKFAYPLWKSGDSIPAKRPFIVRACNLLNGSELLPYRGHKTNGKHSWLPVEVTHEPYCNDVISFTISDNHLYVADNIVTHNCQAIYGFRGALTDSMDRLANLFDMDRLYLTVSFRCAQKIVENAHWLAPDMRYPEWAMPGKVERPVTWNLSMVKEHDAIICRNNAPLFRMAIILLQHGRLPEIAGRDIAAPLSKLMNKLGKPPMPQLAAIEAINEWEERELKRARDGAKSAIRDRAECIRIMLRQTRTLGDAIAYLKHLLARDGRIKLMTIHKSKGLEFDNVFFLDQHLCNIEKGQDANLKYVCETRAKNALTYVTTESLEENETT